MKKQTFKTNATSNSAIVCFNDMFESCDDEHTGMWCNTAIILTRLRKRYGATLKGTNMISFGRLLANTPTLLRRRTGHGTLYLVRERECLGGKENFKVFYDSFRLILSS